MQYIITIFLIQMLVYGIPNILKTTVRKMFFLEFSPRARREKEMIIFVVIVKVFHICMPCLMVANGY